MKTLKKVLAVVLALAMVLGMTVVASATFTDAAEIGADYKEAVEVMNAVGVFIGSNGKMSPKANLTRAEAAKLVTYLLLGEDTAEALPVVALYKDSNVSAWANKYIAYLSNEGIVAGVGAGKFNPTGNVTGYEFGKMLLGCLGYKAEYEGLTGSNWAINTAKLIKSTGIVNATAAKKANLALTREEAAKYCLNALKATTVEYEDVQSIKVGNVEIATAKAASKVTDVILDDEKLDYNKADDAIVVLGQVNTLQLTEKLYGNDLKLDTTTNDAFGRQANIWTYKNTKVGTYQTETPILTYTGLVKGTQLAADLKAAGYVAPSASNSATAEKEVKIYTNGDCAGDQVYDAAAIDTVLKDTGKYFGEGIKTEVYADTDNCVCRIVLVREYLGTVTSITKDDAKTLTVDERALEVTIPELTSVYDEMTCTINAEDGLEGFDAIYESAVKGTTKLLVVPAHDEKVADAIAVAVPGTKTGKVTKVVTGDTMTIGGEALKFAWNFAGSASTSTKEVTVYLDSCGRVIATKAEAVDDKTVAIVDVYNTLGEKNKLIATIDGILSDGTGVTWEVKTNLTSNDLGKVYTYEYDDASANYTLTKAELSILADTKDYENDVRDGAGDTAALRAAYVETGSVAKNAKSATITFSDQSVTLYYAKDVKFISTNTTTGEATVLTGVQEVESKPLTYVIGKSGDDWVIKTVFVENGVKNAATEVGELIFIAGSKTGDVVIEDPKLTGGKNTYGTFDAYVNGELVEDFYGSTGAKIGFYSSYKETVSGAYVLTGNEYDKTGIAVSVGYDIVVKNAVKSNGTVLTLNGVDYSGLEDDIIVNTTATGEIDTVDELKLLDKAVAVAYIADETTNTLKWVYVVYENVDAISLRTIKNGTYNKEYGEFAVDSVSLNYKGFRYTLVDGEYALVGSDVEGAKTGTATYPVDSDADNKVVNKNDTYAGRGYGEHCYVH